MSHLRKNDKENADGDDGDDEDDEDEPEIDALLDNLDKISPSADELDDDANTRARSDDDREVVRYDMRQDAWVWKASVPRCVSSWRMRAV